MAEIIPAILAKDEKEFRRKADAIDGHADLIHIDVMDGTFTGTESFSDACRIGKLQLPADFEVHLMVEDPESYLDCWSKTHCQRVFVHAESDGDTVELLKQVAKFGMEPGLTINPETPVSKIEKAIPHAKVVQVMGVKPGKMGQKFQPVALEKVSELREKFPELVIQVDGGVEPGIARKLADAGADRLVSGHFIFESGSPKKSIAALRKDTEPEL